jgi:CheY-like chemotaxis protein
MTPPTGRPLVLIVEDDASAARVLAQLLREDGYDVEVLLDGGEALARLERDPPLDVVIVDYRLPHADGLAVARAARKHAPAAMVVMLTSYPEVVASRLRADDADAFLVPKPLAYEDLTRLLRTRAAAAPKTS